MCDQTEVEYKPSDIVWVKLSSLWWPAEVQDFDSLDDDVKSGLKKRPIAVVKFFNEDSFEFPKNINQIYHYNCRRKQEFVKKGLDLWRSYLGNPNSRNFPASINKFPGDLIFAEEKTDGDTNHIKSLIEVTDGKKPVQKRSSISTPDSRKSIIRKRSVSPPSTDGKKTVLKRPVSTPSNADGSLIKRPKNYELPSGSTKNLDHIGLVRTKVVNTKYVNNNRSCRGGDPFNHVFQPALRQSRLFSRDSNAEKNNSCKFVCTLCFYKCLSSNDLFLHFNGHYTGIIRPVPPVHPPEFLDVFNEALAETNKRKWLHTLSTDARPSSHRVRKYLESIKNECQEIPSKKIKSQDNLKLTNETPLIKTPLTKTEKKVASPKKHAKKPKSEIKSEALEILKDWDDWEESDSSPSDANITKSLDDSAKLAQPSTSLPADNSISSAENKEKGSLSSALENEEKILPSAVEDNAKRPSPAVENKEKRTSSAVENKEKRSPSTVENKDKRSSSSGVDNKEKRSSYSSVENKDKRSSSAEKRSSSSAVESKEKLSSSSVVENKEKRSSSSTVENKDKRSSSSAVENKEKRSSSAVENKERRSSSGVENKDKHSSSSVENKEKRSSSIENKEKRSSSSVENKEKRLSSSVENNEKRSSSSVETNEKRSSSADKKHKTISSSITDKKHYRSSSSTDKKEKNSSSTDKTRSSSVEKNEKSCFDFDDNEDFNLGHSLKFGQKLPRVISEKQTSKTYLSSKNVEAKSSVDDKKRTLSVDANEALEKSVDDFLKGSEPLGKLPEVPIFQSTDTSKLHTIDLTEEDTETTKTKSEKLLGSLEKEDRRHHDIKEKNESKKKSESALSVESEQTRHKEGKHKSGRKARASDEPKEKVTSEKAKPPKGKGEREKKGKDEISFLSKEASPSHENKKKSSKNNDDSSKISSELSEDNKVSQEKDDFIDSRESNIVELDLLTCSVQSDQKEKVDKSLIGSQELPETSKIVPTDNSDLLSKSNLMEDNNKSNNNLTDNNDAVSNIILEGSYENQASVIKDEIEQLDEPKSDGNERSEKIELNSESKESPPSSAFLDCKDHTEETVDLNEKKNTNSEDNISLCRDIVSDFFDNDETNKQDVKSNKTLENRNVDVLSASKNVNIDLVSSGILNISERVAEVKEQVVSNATNLDQFPLDINSMPIVIDQGNQSPMELCYETISTSDDPTEDDEDANKIVVNVVLKPQHSVIPKNIEALKLCVRPPRPDFVPDHPFERIPLIFHVDDEVTSDKPSSNEGTSNPGEIVIRPLSTQIVSTPGGKLKELIFLKARTPPSMPPDGKYGFIIGPDGTRKFYYFTKTRPSFLKPLDDTSVKTDKPSSQEPSSSTSQQIGKSSSTSKSANNESSVPVNSSKIQPSKTLQKCSEPPPLQSFKSATDASATTSNLSAKSNTPSAKPSTEASAITSKSSTKSITPSVKPSTETSTVTSKSSVKPNTPLVKSSTHAASTYKTSIQTGAASKSSVQTNLLGKCTVQNKQPSLGQLASTSIKPNQFIITVPPKTVVINKDDLNKLKAQSTTGGQSGIVFKNSQKVRHFSQRNIVVKQANQSGVPISSDQKILKTTPVKIVTANQIGLPISGDKKILKTTPVQIVSGNAGLQTKTDIPTDKKVILKVKQSPNILQKSPKKIIKPQTQSTKTLNNIPIVQQASPIVVNSEPLLILTVDGDGNCSSQKITSDSLINLNSCNSQFISLNGVLPIINAAPTSSSTLSNVTGQQDILAEALANTQVLQSETSDLNEIVDPTFVTEQFPTTSLSNSVLETTLTLNQPPIMTPLEVPSSIASHVVHISQDGTFSEAPSSMSLLTDESKSQTVYFGNPSTMATFDIVGNEIVVTSEVNTVSNELILSETLTDEVNSEESLFICKDKDDNVLPEFLKDYDKKLPTARKVSIHDGDR